MKSFSDSALQQLATIIGNRYTGTEITDFFRKVGREEIQHDGTTKWRFVKENLIIIQNNNGYLEILKIIEQLCSPEEFFQRKEDYPILLDGVNEILSHYKLMVNKDGKIIENSQIEPILKSKVTEDAQLFNNRNYHPEIRKHAFKLFNDGLYFHSVFECCKSFNKFVSEKAEVDKYGVALMGATLSLNGCLKLNKQETETERNEQEGLMHLCTGLMKAVRNPQGHEPELCWKMSREDALDVLSLINYLYRQIELTCCYKR